VQLKTSCRAFAARTLDPLQILLAPRLPRIDGTLAVAQQKLSQSVAVAKLIFLGRLARPHQIAQSLVCGVRNPHRSQLAGAVTSRQLFRIAAVRLHPIPGLARHQRRRNHFARHAQLRELPVQHVTGWPSLVATLQPPDWPQLADHLPYRFQPIGDDPQAANLAKRNLDMCGQLLSYAALRRRIYLFAA
jgi:hypothetical protein